MEQAKQGWILAVAGAFVVVGSNHLAAAISPDHIQSMSSLLTIIGSLFAIVGALFILRAADAF